MGATLFCALFGAVYEIFSHGVYSYGMIYAFAFPLILGVIPFSILAMLQKKTHLTGIMPGIYHAGVAILTVGSIVCGILEIYGTTNRLMFIYWLAGAALILVSVVTYLFSTIKK